MNKCKALLTKKEFLCNFKKNRALLGLILNNGVYMPLAYGIGGLISVPQGPVTGFGPPPASFIGQLGQEYFDKSQTPPVLYIFNGQTWSLVANTAPLIVAAAASPQVVNARSGQVTFSGVSIAAGATQSFVISNTSVPAASSAILYTMSGATSGSALSIQSVTNVANTSSTIVVTNGTGATTSIANITFTFLILS